MKFIRQLQVEATNLSLVSIIMFLSLEKNRWREHFKYDTGRLYQKGLQVSVRKMPQIFCTFSALMSEGALGQCNQLFNKRSI